MHIADAQVDQEQPFRYLNGSTTFSIGVVMSEVLTIKQMPAELKQYWAEEAKRHGRSMNKEVLRVLRRNAPVAKPPNLRPKTLKPSWRRPADCKALRWSTSGPWKLSCMKMTACPSEEKS